MSVAVNDLFRWAAFGTVFNQRTMLTGHYALSVAPPNIDEQTATLALLDRLWGGSGDQFETELRAVMPPDWTLDKWEAQKIAPVRYRYQSVQVGVAGAHASTTEATNQAATIEFHTALAGRDQIGVKHIGPIPQALTVQVDGKLAPAYRTLLQTLADEMKAAVTHVGTGLTWVPVIAHKANPGSFTIITNNVVGDTIRTMRARTVGRGE